MYDGFMLVDFFVSSFEFLLLQTRMSMRFIKIQMLVSNGLQQNNPVLDNHKVTP